MSLASTAPSRPDWDPLGAAGARSFRIDVLAASSSRSSDTPTSTEAIFIYYKRSDPCWCTFSALLLARSPPSLSSPHSSPCPAHTAMRQSVPQSRLSKMQDDPSELRDLAEWYRQLAHVGREHHRRARLKMAEYLERRAKELDQRKPGGQI